MIAYLVIGQDPAMSWDCQYKEILVADSFDDIVDYCSELFDDDPYTLHNVAIPDNPKHFIRI